MFYDGNWTEMQSTSNYEPHMTNAEVQMKFSCSFCGICFPTELNLCEHVKANHVNLKNKTVDYEFNVKLPKCSFCPYQSSSKANVTRHEKVHTGERSFQ